MFPLSIVLHRQMSRMLDHTKPLPRLNVIYLRNSFTLSLTFLSMVGLYSRRDRIAVSTRERQIYFFSVCCLHPDSGKSRFLFRFYRSAPDVRVTTQSGGGIGGMVL